VLFDRHVGANNIKHIFGTKSHEMKLGLHNYAVIIPNEKKGVSNY
jgi:hypothetical protein